MPSIELIEQNFAELCGVLTRFHDLAEEIKRVKAGKLRGQ